jgi:hypothetical protein
VPVTLDDAWDKLRWAKHHFEILRPQIESFEQRDSHTFSYEVDPQEGQYTFYVHGLEPVDPDWGLIIGDCLHNARTALDYLMVRLEAWVTGTDPADLHTIGFPIIEDPQDFASKVGKLKKDPALGPYITRIEELQPFNNGHPAIWGTVRYGDTQTTKLRLLPGALQRLSILDNLDKHRVVHAAWLGGVFHAHPFPGVPDDFVSQGANHGMGPFEDGAEVGSLRFKTPLPREWQPSQVDMQRHFRLQVSFAKPLAVNGVLEVLPFCLWGAETVLRLFDPVFSHGQPPLPAVAALGMEDDYYAAALRHLALHGFDVPDEYAPDAE